MSDAFMRTDIEEAIRETARSIKYKARKSQDPEELCHLTEALRQLSITYNNLTEEK